MKKKLAMIAVVIGVSFIVVPFVLAGGCGGGAAKAATPVQAADTALAATQAATTDTQAATGEVVNVTCPVMGGKIDKNTPYTAEYKGKTIGFCCAACIKAFNADPEKYMKNVETEQEK